MIVISPPPIATTRIITDFDTLPSADRTMTIEAYFASVVEISFSKKRIFTFSLVSWGARAADMTGGL